MQTMFVSAEIVCLYQFTTSCNEGTVSSRSMLRRTIVKSILDVKHLKLLLVRLHAVWLQKLSCLCVKL
jgi:hypothetical protein